MLPKPHNLHILFYRNLKQRPETVLAFLVSHFKQIPESVWIKRVVEGKVHWADGEPVTQTTKYRPATRVYYYREVESETKYRFSSRYCIKMSTVF